VPFLLLDDAKDFLTGQLQDFGNGALRDAQAAANAVNLPYITQRLQDYGSSLLPAAPQLPQPPDPSDITARLQDFADQHLQNTLATLAQPPQPAQTFEQPPEAIPTPEPSQAPPEATLSLDQTPWPTDALDRLDAAVQAARRLPEAIGQGLGAAADVVEQRRQADIEREARFGQDFGSTFQSLLEANPMTASGADLSQPVSAGLTAAGVDPTISQILGQVANVVAPAGLELGLTRGLPAVERAATSPAVQELLTSRLPAEAQVGAASGLDALQAAAGAPGEAASRLGTLVATALSPVENLAPETRSAIVDYANMVGRQSDAARVLAENEMRTAGARLDIPAVQEQVQQRMFELRDDAARSLVQNLQDQGLAAPAGASAPADFRLATDNPRSYLAGYVFDPDVAGPIRAVTDTSAIAANPLGNAVLQAIGTAKGTLFSLSNFHTITEGLNAAFTSPATLANYVRAFVSDSFAQGLRGEMADTFDAAAQAGVTQLAERARAEDVGGQITDVLKRRLVSSGVAGAGSAATGYTETKLSGGSEEEARRNAAIAGLAGATAAGLPLGGRGTLPEILQSALWDRAVPLAKATAWDALTKGGLDPQVAANVVNQRFGGLNYAAMGRSATLLDAQRLSLMASDWNEATVRQLGSALFGGDGSGVTRGFLARTIGGMLTATQAANLALSGHTTLQNQPGHQFEVEMPNPNGGYLHFGLLPGNVQSYLNLAATELTDPSRRLSAPVNFVTGRLSMPAGVGLELGQAALGKPPFQVAKAGPVALGEEFAPIGLQQVVQSTLKGGLNPAVAVGLAAAGVNPRYTAAPTGGTGFRAPLTRALTSHAARTHVARGGSVSPQQQAREDVLQQLQDLLAEALRVGDRQRASDLQDQIDQLQAQA